MYNTMVSAIESALFEGEGKHILIVVREQNISQKFVNIYGCCKCIWQVLQLYHRPFASAFDNKRRIRCRYFQEE